MNPDRLQQLETLYNDALALKADDRPAFLDRVCGGDSDLRRELESLLSTATDSYLDKDALQLAAESLAQAPQSSLMGQSLGRYQLLSLVGRGGMGEVYCAVDSRLNRLVAIKVLPAYMRDNLEWVNRLNEEARAVAALNHPNICTLFDIGTDAGMHYLVFEYLAGELLSERLAKGSLPMREVTQFAIQMAEAIRAAHHEGIIHCDLKPHNIMLMKAGLKLLDFGIAELRYSDQPWPSRSKRTSSGTSPGTLAYMSPEQIEGGETDVRTDIFGFGLVTYQMVTGRPAFCGTDQASLSHAVLNDTPIPASQLAPQTPPALDFLLARCLAKQPAERWQSIADVLFMLKWIAS
jgi:eukaryotic-like serine/threonine-protein kinase